MYTSTGFLLECFLYEGYVHTWECAGWKKTENLIGGGVGIRMSWGGEDFEKLISGEGETSISDLRVLSNFFYILHSYLSRGNCKAYYHTVFWKNSSLRCT